MDRSAVILAVDDTPENLDVIKGLLATDYQVRVAPNGQIGLKIAKAQQPDIILLDIMMPGIDGYEVCRQLKADPETASIPVIFLTAKTDVADEAAGFELGACDYITKPVNPTLLKARVQTHLALKQNIDRLEDLSQQLAAAKGKMEDELNVGQRIQLSMLPTSPPAHDNFDIAATMRAARQVGGDLYDYFFITPRLFCVCIADISDKGVPASLFMAVTKTLLRANSTDDESTASIVTRINDALAEDNDAAMFATLFLAIIDIQSGEMTYTNAGHNKPFIRRQQGGVDIVPDLHGPVAGAMDGLAYGESHITLHHGDTLLLYTDGVSEAMDKDDNLYSEERVEALLASQNNASPQQMIEHIIASVDSFANDVEQSDDITLLAFKFNHHEEDASHQIQLRLVNQLNEIERLSNAFEQAAESVDMPMDVQLKTNLVFDELISNIVKYAFDDDAEHPIWVAIDLAPHRMTITIEDDGLPFNPFTRKDPDIQASIEEREIGGLGIHLVKEMMDQVDYKRQANKNKLILSKTW